MNGNVNKLCKRERECDVDDECKFRAVQGSSKLQSRTGTKKPRVKQKSYRKKVESDWSHENTIKLIAEVKKRRGLWDTGCDEYKLPKENVWQEVADAIPTSFNDCKGKWANLRTTFNSNLHKLRKRRSGQGTDKLPDIHWRYFKPMMFLETVKVHRTTQSTSSAQLESANTDESVVSFLGFNEELGSSSPSSSGQQCSQKSTTTLSSGRNKELKDRTVESLESIRSRDLQSKDTCTVFAEYIAAELRTLSAEQATVARAKLRRAFTNIMDEVTLMVTQRPADVVNSNEQN